jgi:hypothetical protein
VPVVVPDVVPVVVPDVVPVVLLNRIDILPNVAQAILQLLKEDLELYDRDFKKVNTLVGISDEIIKAKRSHDAKNWLKIENGVNKADISKMSARLYWASKIVINKFISVCTLV